MSNTWILVANSAEAHLYTSPKAKLLNGHGKLSLLEDFSHPNSRKRSSELLSDRFGHTLHGTYIEASDPKKIEAYNFAQQLAARLEQGRKNNKFDELILVAPGHFQSMLKYHVSQPLYNMIERTIDRDYTHFSQKNLVEQIQQWL